VNGFPPEKEESDFPRGPSGGQVAKPVLPGPLKPAFQRVEILGGMAL